LVIHDRDGTVLKKESHSSDLQPLKGHR
jgi:hypothetical protein